ncbi:vasoactive intestinal polypeptide receptor 2-like [Seriola lalandi dorsalis]|uniref:vasoactive intestinal polypeptide receptor 2-like n=1 Tax=Seriola lalandi dorsalis TaxID=1841481 RepID=UPI000C6FABB1|nr:vasoactive intestinal polypeptide receptor 2-like [Seriola lalandi dorsalis]XP_056219653.1 vasoactive intestinal polypeptide receptor 2-like [Seriola aureovittata]
MSFTHRLVVLLLGFSLHHTVDGKFPNCQFHWEIQRAERECRTQLQQQHTPPPTTGCRGEWGFASCWHNAAVGEVMTLPCPSPLLQLFGKNGNLSRNCTESGWSDVYPVITVACWSNDTGEPNELVFYRVVRILSTLGHSLSLIALLTSTVIICLFRRLHCMRNYIHLNLFLSFMLRAVAVLTKDTLLFSDDEDTDCSTQPSLVGCRASLVFFNYFIMANFFWLLVEGLYLHMLLLVIHTYSTPLSIYMFIGWGIPFVFLVAWIICRIKLEDTWCWEMNENPIPNRLINWPIMASVIINFILFISIIRILVQKLRCTDVGGNEKSQYRRLAKSTLLLIPLFGVNYVVFVYLMEPPDKNMNRIKIFFDLGLGSFQGLIVAVLYCFLNSEVQSELRRTWRSLSLKRYVGRDYRLHAMSISRNGTENSAQFPRNSRAQSILQTETTML